MTPLELFAWTLSAILAISFIISLIVVSRKPQILNKKKSKKALSTD
ncbi:hypothetical protein [Cytobacillus firmus]|nr:hypothetical protein [Cytobacillus firmus]MBX9972522.1 hypothetical protein [Cytobacillus firmus]MDM5226103.1 hypothetical protein [Cytobacillus sp. NJ13]